MSGYLFMPSFGLHMYFLDGTKRGDFHDDVRALAFSFVFKFKDCIHSKRFTCDAIYNFEFDGSPSS